MRRNTRKAYTLIELLLVLALIVMLFCLMAAGCSAVQRHTIARAETFAERIQRETSRMQEGF